MPYIKYGRHSPLTLSVSPSPSTVPTGFRSELYFGLTISTPVSEDCRLGSRVRVERGDEVEPPEDEELTRDILELLAGYKVGSYGA